MIEKAFNWLDNLGNQMTEYILNPFTNLPGYFQFIVLILVGFLSIIGLICVAKKALKTVVGVACAFIVLLIIWLIIT